MIEINAIDDICPVPVIKAKNALKEMKPAQELIITVGNIIATQNLEKLAAQLGATYNVEEISPGNYRVSITKNAEEIISIDGGCDNTIVVISSNKMGQGDDELGEVLMKGFIYALSELETSVNTLIFYNSGAYITAQGSKYLEDLEKLQNKNTAIMTCGTCLDYYGLTVKIGEVSNMYSIVEKMAEATKIIKP